VVRDPSLREVQQPLFEAALRAARFADPQAFLVYADWLTAHGEPRGDLIRVQHALEHQTEPAVLGALKDQQARLLLHEKLDGPLRVNPGTVWRWGFAQGLKLRYAQGRDQGPAVGVRDLVLRYLADPSARLLQEFAGVDAGDPREEKGGAGAWAAVCAGLERAPPTLETLSLSTRREVYLTRLSVLPAQLQRLQLEARELLLEPLEHAVLSTLSVTVHGLTPGLVEGLLGSKLPALRALAVAVREKGAANGREGHAFEALLKHLKGLKLERLALHGVGCDAALMGALLAAPVLPGLRSLDLSQCELAPEAVGVLLSRAGAWKHLESMDLYGLRLTAELEARLRAVGPALRLSPTLGGARR
jgi:uncharacterized protein (TIGR02996 family)